MCADLLLPIGTIISYGGDSTREEELQNQGWLVCDGRLLSREEYNLLFKAIGELWGKGDGQKTFKLPDLRGRVLRCVDLRAGRDIGGRFSDEGIMIEDDNRDPVGTFQEYATAMPKIEFVTDSQAHTHDINVLEISNEQMTGENNKQQVHPVNLNTNGHSHFHFIPYKQNPGSSVRPVTAYAGPYPPNNVLVNDRTIKTNSNEHSHAVNGSTGNATDTHKHSFNFAHSHRNECNESVHQHQITGGDPETRMANAGALFLIKWK